METRWKEATIKFWQAEPLLLLEDLKVYYRQLWEHFRLWLIQLIGDNLPYVVFKINWINKLHRIAINCQPLLLLWETDVNSALHNHRDWSRVCLQFESLGGKNDLHPWKAFSQLDICILCENTEAQLSSRKILFHMWIIQLTRCVKAFILWWPLCSALSFPLKDIFQNRVNFLRP